MTRVLKFILLSLFISCTFNSQAAFVSQPDTIETGKFLLLTPLKKSFADRVGLRTKEHLMINENERVKYSLKGSEKVKRGRIIRIMDNEIQFYNQVTGKVDYVQIDNIAMISRASGWKAWAGNLSVFTGVLLLSFGIIFGIVTLITLIIDGLDNNDELLIIFSIYGIFSILAGLGITYAAKNLLYKYKKFKIGREYKIGVYSMKKLNKE